MREGQTRATYEDDIDGWSDIAMDLCKLRMAMEWAQAFQVNCGKYIDKKDQIEMIAMNSKYDLMYWKYWEKLVKKIRGI